MSHLRRSLSLGLVVVLAACSGGGDDDATSDAEISGQAVERPHIELEVTRSEYISPHRTRGPIPQAEAAKAVAVVQQLFQATVLDAAVLDAPGDATLLFTRDALRQVRGQDYRALVDDQVGPLDGLRAAHARVGLAGLAGAEGHPELIVAAIDWDLHSPDRAVRIRRSGELSLVPQAGRWRIAAYDVVTERTVRGVTTTTTAGADGAATADDGAGR